MQDLGQRNANIQLEHPAALAAKVLCISLQQFW